MSNIEEEPNALQEAIEDQQNHIIRIRRITHGLLVIDSLIVASLCADVGVNDWQVRETLNRPPEELLIGLAGLTSLLGLHYWTKWGDVYNSMVHREQMLARKKEIQQVADELSTDE